MKLAVVIFIVLVAAQYYEVVASEESDSTLIKSDWANFDDKYQEPLQGRDGRNGTEGPQGVPGRNGRDGNEGRKGRKGPKGERGGRGAPGPEKGGVVYTHWGNDTCSDSETDTEILYAGIVVGTGQSYIQYGGGANYLCLPYKDPQILSTTYKGNQAYLYGIEYDSPILTDKNKNVPCAVCYTSTKAVQLMIPGRITCPSSSWTEEYEGYLMTARYNQYGNQNYICVDKDGDSVLHANTTNLYGPLLYHVTARCSGIPCPPYDDKKYVTCVVCTK